MTFRMYRRSLSLLVAALLTITISFPAYAETYTGSGSIEESPVTITGSVSALTLSVTHPTSVNWIIDPGLSTPFVAPTLQVTNNTKCPIVVFVTSFSKNAAGSTLPFTDTHPTKYPDWSILPMETTKAEFALGIKIRTEGSAWKAGFNPETRWSHQTGVLTCFGTLPSEAIGIFDFDARHGLAFDTAYTAQHDLVFLFTLN